MCEGDWIRPGATAVIAEHATASTPESGVARRLTKDLVCQVLHSVGDFVYLQPRSINWTDQRDEPIPEDNPLRVFRSLVRPLHARNESKVSRYSSPRGPCTQTLRGTISYNCIIDLLHSEKSLPEDVSRHVASFLAVENVRLDEVAVTSASSNRGDFPLGAVLGSKPGTWWISGEGTMRCRGEEYLQFRLSPDERTRRVSFFGLSIPPMPYGPLSVRHFRLDWSLDGETWSKGGKEHTLETIDVEGMQAFELSPAIDAAHVRLVCLQNVVWAERFHYSNGASGPTLTGLDCVGLYHVRMK